MAGGLGGLGGGVADYLNSPTGGNMLQALGFSLMSSPRNAPLQNFGEYYTGLKGQRMKQDAIDLERSDLMAGRDAMAAALIASGVPEQEARTLAINPQAARVMLEQMQRDQEKAANEEWFARNQGVFGGDTGGAAGGLGGLGGAPAVTGAVPEAGLSFPGVSDAPSATIAPERPQMDQSYGGASVFAEPGAAQTNANRFTPGGAVADTGFLEAAPAPGPGAEIPLAQPPANKTIDYLKANDPEAATLVSEENGITPRDAYEISVQRQQGQKAFESRTQDAQAKLDSLYGLRERAANALMTAPKGVAAQVKMGLDNLDWQIERLEKQLAAQDIKPTDDIREYEFAKTQGYEGTFQDFMLSMKKAGANNVNVNTGSNSSKFADESDKAAATRMNDIVVAGQSAPQTMADMQQLIDLGTQIGTGKEAQVKAFLGPYAEMVGANIDNLGEMQAYEAITSRLAPQMRATGSGSSSDRDVSMFLQSLPNLRNKPQGNEIIANTMKAVAQNKVNAADIASRAQSGEISWQEADKQIRSLPNPYDLFKEFQSQSGDGWQELSPGVRVRKKQE